MVIDSRPEIISPRVEEYLYGILRPRDSVLAFLEEDAEKNDVPIVGPLVGNLLSMIAMNCQAKNILEVGTATGYSGIWMARVAKKNGGKLTTIEMDPSRAKIAKKSFQDAGVDSAVDLIQGDAKVEVPRLLKTRRGRFDLAFIDVGDKSLYTDLLEDCISALRIGGYLLADNTLWSGKVADTSKNDRDTKTLREYNKRVYADERLHPVIFPLRDGVTVALKLSD
jgi:caffeoyl-CoA O-methyltransferase